jgi:uncharacterized membrane protein
VVVLVKREILPISIIALMFAIAMFADAYVKVNWKGDVPMQWGQYGEVTGWTGKIAALYLIPVLTAIFYLAFMLLPHLGVYRKEATHFANAFYGFKVIFVFVMGVIYVATIIPALGIWGSIDPMHIIVPAIALVFFYVGHMLSYSQSPHREKEEMANELHFKKTNMFGSNLFWLCGALILVSLVAPADARLKLMLIPLMLAAIAVFFYSLLEYRKTLHAHKQSKRQPARRGKARKK